MIDTSRNMLYHLGNLNAESRRISEQTGTGKSINTGSENSILHSNVINLEDKLRVTTGLMLQISKTQVMNSSADTSLKELKIALGGDEFGGGIQDDLLKALNSGMHRSDKLALATNLRGIRDNMFDLMNVKVDGEFVFTGSDTTVQTIEKDPDYADNGKITYNGDGFLREVAVQPNSYRDRGVTAYETMFYTSSKGIASEPFTFQEGERIIDNEGFEWKLNVAGTELQKYDYNGNIYHPLENDVTSIAITSSTVADESAAIAGTGQSVRATYTLNVPGNPLNRLFEAKHNYFDDLNVTINALEGYATKLDGTKGAEIDDELVRQTVSNGLEQNEKQIDATSIGHGELGGRNKVFEVAYEKLTAQKTHYDILILETTGADLAKLAMESKALELTYQSLYTTISKMNNLSLLNYIK